VKSVLPIDDAVVLPSSPLASSVSPGLLGYRGQPASWLIHNLSASVGALLLGLVVIVAIVAPLLAPYDPIRIDASRALYSPGLPYIFGTDQYGRDVFSRVLLGARLSLAIGPIAVGMALVPGVSVGLLAGYYGGWLDALLMRCVDVLLAFPGILLALGIMAVLGPGLPSMIVAIGLSSIPTYARLVRGSVLSTHEQLYVVAARTVGARDAAILVRHILPNVAAPISVAATLGIGSAILAAAALSFLGLGSQPPTPEWGRMLSDGRAYLRDQWWIATFPGLAVMLTILGFNLLGDGLRDILDPRLRA
jgi:peptide/nickel transport system permease protein